MKIRNIETFLQELNADPRSVISRLQDITERSLDGVKEQKISPRSEEPVECLVFDLRTAVAAQKLIWDIAVHLTEVNEAETAEASCTLVFEEFSLSIPEGTEGGSQS